MTILLLTNDDGIDAPGLAALRRAASGLADVHVVAPGDARSGCGHQATMRDAIRTESRGPGATAVWGTPVDCVRLALHGLAPWPALVVSGVNAGSNLGVDVFRSGTVAAAREAAHHGIPSIAISQLKRPEWGFPWADAERVLRALLGTWLSEPPRAGAFFNVNLPHLPPGAPPPVPIACPVDPSPWPLTFEADADGAWRYGGRLLDRPRVAGSDVDVCFGGAIAVSTIAAH